MPHLSPIIWTSLYILIWTMILLMVTTTEALNPTNSSS